MFSVLTTEKGFAYKTNNQGAKEFYTRMPSVAYNFSVRTDYDKHTADLYMNNRIMEKNIPIASDITGVELRLNLLDAGSRQEKMNLIISSGETFDIMMTDPTGPLSLAVNSRRNAFLDLTDLREQGYICSI